jgi:hypothetical protein
MENLQAIRSSAVAIGFSGAVSSEAIAGVGVKWQIMPPPIAEAFMPILHSSKVVALAGAEIGAAVNREICKVAVRSGPQSSGG